MITQTELSVPQHIEPMRLDRYLSTLWPEHSREQIKSWILGRQVYLNGEIVTKPKNSVRGGDIIQAEMTWREPLTWQPESMALDILYEDDDILVINKPAGLVTHPGAGINRGTLANGLLAHHDIACHLPRAGIVHRLDKDTTGCMVVAKSERAYHTLIKAIKAHEVERTYQAIVQGRPWISGKFDEPIGRDRHHRTRMAVDTIHGKPATTHYQVIESYGEDFARLSLKLETGRTHQIRVHCQHHGYPLVGDRTYNRAHKRGQLGDAAWQAVREMPRQALHAAKLKFAHPVTGEKIEFKAPLPEDMKALVEVLGNEGSS